jgi:hypothetical protein
LATDKIEKIKIGTHDLNQNPVNYFEQVESIAFSPADLIPGVEAQKISHYKEIVFTLIHKLQTWWYSSN